MRLVSPEQQKVLTSPVRIEIIERMQSGKATSIAEVAERMGRTPASLYHHFHKLVAAGVLVEQGQRRAGNRWETMYGLAARHFHMELDQTSARNVDCYCRSASAILRLTDRGFTDAVENHQVVTSGRYRNLDANMKKARLTKAGLARVNRLLDELQKVMREEDAGGDGQLCALTTVLIPLPDKTPTKKGLK